MPTHAEENTASDPIIETVNEEPIIKKVKELAITTDEEPIISSKNYMIYTGGFIICSLQDFLNIEYQLK